MSHHKHLPDNSAHRHSSTPAPESDQHPSYEDPAVTPDQVARRAYFTYLNSWELPGHDVQHWLKAESDLLEEHALKRSHAYDRPDKRPDRQPLPAQS
jgi:hypothetical protein